MYVTKEVDTYTYTKGDHALYEEEELFEYTIGLLSPADSASARAEQIRKICPWGPRR